MRTFILGKKIPVNIKTGWDLPKCLHLDTPLLELCTKKLYRTKNNCMHRPNSGPKDTKKRKKNLKTAVCEEREQTLGDWSKSRTLGMSLCPQQHEGVGNPSKPSL